MVAQRGGAQNNANSFSHAEQKHLVFKIMIRQSSQIFYDSEAWGGGVPSFVTVDKFHEFLTLLS